MPKLYARLYRVASEQVAPPFPRRHHPGGHRPHERHPRDEFAVFRAWAATAADAPESHCSSPHRGRTAVSFATGRAGRRSEPRSSEAGLVPGTKPT